MSCEIEVREKIIRLFNENPNWTFKTIARKAKVSRNTVSRVIRVYGERLTINRKQGSGKKRF